LWSTAPALAAGMWATSPIGRCGLLPSAVASRCRSSLAILAIVHCHLRPIPIYGIETSGLMTMVQRSTGCSGDALQFAFHERGVSSFQVNRRSDDGLTWWFQATFKVGVLDPMATAER